MNPVFQNGANRGVVPSNMINRPTLVPTDGPNAAQMMPNASPYFAIVVDATDQALVDAGTPVKVVLFDANRQYQNKTGYFMPLELKITGKGEPYQAIMDDMAHVAGGIDVIQMQICNSTDPDCNFNFFPTLNLIHSQRGMQPSVIKTLYPDMGVSENQYHLDRATFQANIVVDQRKALIFDIDPGSKVMLAFYQYVELGRKQ